MFVYLAEEMKELLDLGLTYEEVEGWLEFFYTKDENA